MPDVWQRLVAGDADPLAGNATGFGKYFRSALTQYGRVVEEGGLQP